MVTFFQLVSFSDPAHNKTSGVGKISCSQVLLFSQAPSRKGFPIEHCSHSKAMSPSFLLPPSCVAFHSDGLERGVRTSEVLPLCLEGFSLSSPHPAFFSPSEAGTGYPYYPLVRLYTTLLRHLPPCYTFFRKTPPSVYETARLLLYGFPRSVLPMAFFSSLSSIVLQRFFRCSRLLVRHFFLVLAGLLYAVSFKR